MTGEHQIRDAMRSLDATLDDVKREHVWRAIDGAIDGEPTLERARRPWLAYALVAGACAASALIGYLARGDTPDDDLGAGSLVVPTTLVARAGQQVVHERHGISLTLIGPGVAAIRDGDGDVHVRVERGVVVADRSESAPALAVEAGGSTTTTRDRRFAVRVQPGSVMFGAGDRVRAVLERDTIDPATDRPATHAATDRPATHAATDGPAGSPPPAIIAPRPEAPVRAPEPVAEGGERPPPVLPEIPLAASELYARAEAALHVGDRDGAAALLARILAEHAGDPLVDAARYDLALIAIARGDIATARELVRVVIESGRDPNVRAAATRLRDRLR